MNNQSIEQIALQFAVQLAKILPAEKVAARAYACADDFLHESTRFSDRQASLEKALEKAIEIGTIVETNATKVFNEQEKEHYDKIVNIPPTMTLLQLDMFLQDIVDIQMTITMRLKSTDEHCKEIKDATDYIKKKRTEAWA